MTIRIMRKDASGGRLRFSRVRGRRLFLAYAARHHFDRFGFFPAREGEGMKDFDVAGADGGEFKGFE